MFSPPNIPNQSVPPKTKRCKKRKNLFWQKCYGVSLFVSSLSHSSCSTAWVIITGISDVGGGFGSTVIDWVKEASINPENERGFKHFLRLILTTGFVGLVVAFFKRKSGDPNE